MPPIIVLYELIIYYTQEMKEIKFRQRKIFSV